MYESNLIPVLIASLNSKLVGDKSTLYSPNTIEVCWGFLELMDVTSDVYWCYMSKQLATQNSELIRLIKLIWSSGRIR